MALKRTKNQLRYTLVTASEGLGEIGNLKATEDLGGADSWKSYGSTETEHRADLDKSEVGKKIGVGFYWPW